jgi:hypothetical protein
VANGSALNSENLESSSYQETIPTEIDENKNESELESIELEPVDPLFNASGKIIPYNKNDFYFNDSGKTALGTVEDLDILTGLLNNLPPDIKLLYASATSDLQEEKIMTDTQVRDIIGILQSPNIKTFAEMGNPATGGMLFITILDSDNNFIVKLRSDGFWLMQFVNDDSEIIFDCTDSNIRNIFEIAN